MGQAGGPVGLINLGGAALRTVADTVDKHVAARLRLRRLQVGIAERDAAQRFGVSVRKLARLEAGEIPIRTEWLDAACDLFGVRTSYFFRGMPGGSHAGEIPQLAPLGEQLGQALFLAPCLDLLARNAAAEVREVTIARQPVCGYLPLMVMQVRRLVEKHARAAGLGDLTVHYVSFHSGAAVNDGLLTGRIQIAAGGVPPFLLLWDRTRPDLGVKALSAISSLPQYLITRNPAVRTIADFCDYDRINVAAPQASLPAILLEMAAAKTFGIGSYNRLNRLTVGLPQAEGAAQLISGRGEITADFIGAPFAYEELDAPGVRLVLRSEDLMGPVTNQLLYTTSAFHNENPKIVAAVMAAFDEAIELVRKDRQLAGEAFVKVEGTRPLQIARMINDRSISFSGNPHGLIKFAEFMHETGSIGAMPASWEDLFFRDQAARLSGD